MKLYYSPGACSLAPHIALTELDLPHTLARVDLHTHRLEDGSDYRAVNPKGYVPALTLDDGTTLTEAGVVLQYIADLRPGALAPEYGSLGRYRLMEWLNFIATEIHKGFGPLWNRNAPDAVKDAARKHLKHRYEFVDSRLRDSAWLTGERFTIADAYLYVVTEWSGPLEVDLSSLPRLSGFRERVAGRPAVQRALREEGRRG